MEKQRRQKFIFWIFIFTCVTIWVSLFFINNAWPVEPANSLPEVESWRVVEEGTNFGNLFVTKFHQDPNDPAKLGFTMWFPNKDKNFEYEVFVRMVDFTKKDGGKVDTAQARGSIKLENGNWSEVVSGNKTLLSLGLFNGERAAIFRSTDDQGETKAFRAFLLKDLVKPKN